MLEIRHAPPTCTLDCAHTHGGAHAFAHFSCVSLSEALSPNVQNVFAFSARTSCAQRGQLDLFTIAVPALGEVKKLLLSYDTFLVGPEGWYLEEVRRSLLPFAAGRTFFSHEESNKPSGRACIEQHRRRDPLPEEGAANVEFMRAVAVTQGCPHSSFGSVFGYPSFAGSASRRAACI